uniref:Transmembrane protein 238 n=1 Tax=Accipiter nisus TaxID=211598 RepID=A0A8B9M5V7_9AVES
SAAAGARREPLRQGAWPRARRWRRRSPAMAAPGGLGRCVAAFWLALAFDALGLAVLLAGVFADVFFSDLLIYAGGIGIFLSLVWWVFWYAGNLEVPPEELRDDVGLAPPKGRGESLLRGLVHGLSLRLSSAFAPSPRPRAPGGRRRRPGRGEAGPGACHRAGTGLLREGTAGGKPGGRGGGA